MVKKKNPPRHWSDWSYSTQLASINSSTKYSTQADFCSATGTVHSNCSYQIKLTVNGLWNISFVSLALTLWLLSFLSRPIRWKESSLPGKHQCTIKPGSAWARFTHSICIRRTWVKGHRLPARHRQCDRQLPEKGTGKERGWRTLDGEGCGMWEAQKEIYAEGVMLQACFKCKG